MDGKRIDFLGCPVDNLTMAEVITRIDAFIESGSPHQITPINASKIFLMGKHPRLDEIVKTSDIVIPEYAVVWGSKVLNRPLVEHIGGIMLMKALLEVAPTKGYRIYFLGARQEVVKTMVGRLKLTYTGLNIVGYHDGYLGNPHEKEVIQELQHCKPDILFVAMGTPKQEYWIRTNMPQLGVPVCMGVGGSFDVLAGLRKEAPSWMRHGFEWIYRLFQDPKNLWKRYLITNPVFVYKVLSARFRDSILGQRLRGQKLRVIKSVSMNPAK